MGFESGYSSIDDMQIYAMRRTTGEDGYLNDWEAFSSVIQVLDGVRMAVAYLASYLAGAKFISSCMVASILKRLVEWCFEYCQLEEIREKKLNPGVHRIFYSRCQVYAAKFMVKTTYSNGNSDSEED